ncbi:hypothetical protein HDV57DRAFT_185732 [Trichoderma longibrachiatum]
MPRAYIHAILARAHALHAHTSRANLPQFFNCFVPTTLVGLRYRPGESLPATLPPPSFACSHRPLVGQHSISALLYNLEPSCATNLSSSTRLAAASTTNTPLTAARHTEDQATTLSSAQSTLAMPAVRTQATVPITHATLATQTRVTVVATPAARATDDGCCLR